MNELQKKMVVIGSTAFIVWFLIGYENSGGFWRIDDIDEFIVDFITVMPGSPKAKVKSRVILTPEHAKRFKKAMEENIQRYEKANGIIKANDTPNIPLNFGPTGEA